MCSEDSICKKYIRAQRNRIFWLKSKSFAIYWLMSNVSTVNRILPFTVQSLDTTSVLITRQTFI